MSAPIPENLHDLLERPIVVAFATNQSRWSTTSDACLGEPGRRPSLDQLRRRAPQRPKCARQPQGDRTGAGSARSLHWVEIRGQVVEFDESDAALAHINKLSGIYAGNEDYYAFNPGGKGQEQRVIYKIAPSKVNGM